MYVMTTVWTGLPTVRQGISRDRHVLVFDP